MAAFFSDRVIAFLTCSDRIDWPCKYFYLQINDVSIRDCPLMDKVWSKNPLSNPGAFGHALGMSISTARSLAGADSDSDAVSSLRHRNKCRQELD